MSKLDALIPAFFKFLNNIKGIINGKRLSASGWICMGKCDEKYIFPKNIKEIYDIRISKNKKLKNH